MALARALPERIRREGACRTVVLEEPAGAGRSRLLDEVKASATMPVTAAGGSQDGLHTPYGMAMDLLGVQLGHPVGADAEERLFARFDAMAAGGQLLVIVDDAQWADAGSLELVTRIVQASRDLPVAMLPAVRPEPVLLVTFGRRQTQRIAAESSAPAHRPGAAG